MEFTDKGGLLAGVQESKRDNFNGNDNDNDSDVETFPTAEGVKQRQKLLSCFVHTCWIVAAVCLLTVLVTILCHCIWGLLSVHVVVCISLFGSVVFIATVFVSVGPRNHEIANFGLSSLAHSHYFVVSLESWLFLSDLLFLGIFFYNVFIKHGGSNAHTIDVLIVAMQSNTACFVVLLVLHVLIIINANKANGKATSCCLIFSDVFVRISSTLVPIKCCKFGECCSLPVVSHRQDKMIGKLSRLKRSLEKENKQRTCEYEDVVECIAFLQQEIYSSTGWSILTWQLLVIELYLLGSQEIGIYILNMSGTTQTVLYGVAVVLHWIIVFTVINVCKRFLSVCEEIAETEPSKCGEIAVPLYMGFFGVLYRLWSVVTAVLVCWEPVYFGNVLDLKWEDKVFWGAEAVLALTEMFAIYYIFVISFMKRIDLNKFILRDYQNVLDLYYAMLAYCTATIVMAVFLLSVFNPKIFYEFLLSVQFAMFGKDIKWADQICNHGNIDGEGPSSTRKPAKCLVISQVYYAYYYVALVIFLTLGRSNRVSFLWRSIAQVCNTLAQIHAKYERAFSRLASGTNSDHHETTHGPPLSLCLQVNGHEKHNDDNNNNDNFDNDHDNDGGSRKVKSTSGYESMWFGLIICAFAMTLFFGSRFAIQYPVMWSIMLGVSGALCVLYCGVICCHDLKILWRWQKQPRCNLTPSEWMFVVATLLSCGYLIIAATQSVKFVSIFTFLAVIVVCQAVIAVNENYLKKQSRSMIGMIIIFNILFMIAVVCNDLGEQLELNDELVESYQEDGTYKVRKAIPVLIASAILFANLEHFWGVMEACQEALSDNHGHSSH